MRSTSATAYSTVNSGYTSAISGLPALATQIVALPNLALFPTGASFSIDQAINIGAGTLALAPSTAALSLGCGSGVVLGQTGLNNITASTVIFGSPEATVGITAGASVTLPSTVTNLSLVTPSVITINTGVAISDPNVNGTITLQSNTSPVLTGTGALSANSASGTVAIVPIAVATSIGLGTGTGAISLTQAKLNQISAANLTIGSSTMTAAITVTNTTGNPVTIPTGVTNLTLETSGTISLSSAASSLVDSHANGIITLQGSGLTLSGAVSESSGTGTVVLNATGTATASGAITAADLLLLGSGATYTLTSTSNNVRHAGGKYRQH